MLPEMVVSVTKASKPKPDWKKIAALYLEGFLPQAISEKTGIGSNTIRVGLAKRGITKVRREQSATVVANVDLVSSSRNTRTKLAAEVERTLAKVSECDPRKPEALNLHADTLQKVAKTASLVHGWGESNAVSVVLAGVITDRPEQEAIDVESEVDSGTNLGTNEENPA